MRFSQAFIPTLKETPAEAEVVSHQLMLRAGMIRKLASGVYTWLPLGLRALRKVERIIREEMDAAGARELLMPGVQPAELWQESGRWEHYGRELLRFKDRHDHDYCLAPTHEEVITDLVRREVRSYRDMPLNLYQFQTKFRDEIRPRFGVMRSREFIMKDGYSFDPDEESSAASYKLMHQAYSAVFTRLGLEFAVVEADSGAIGGSFSHEFMVLADTGEDAIASCQCGWAANFEKAEVAPPKGEPPAAVSEIAQVDTPGAHTVEEVAKFLGVSPAQVAKTLVYLADGKPVAAMVRGDRQLNEVKLKNLLDVAELELAPASVILEVSGGPVGFTGPVGLNIPLYADQELYFAEALVTGANQADAHLTGVHMARDAQQAKQADLRVIEPGDPCPRCGADPVFARGIEVGHIFRLGTKYSQAMGANYLDAEGQSRPLIMGCYGIGVTRIVASAIEQGHDQSGIIFPLAIAPYSVTILPMAADGEVMEAAQKLYGQLRAAGIDVLMDDRDLRPGVKFKDADLIGIPLRVVVGAKGLKEGAVELKHRQSGDVDMIPVEQAANRLAEMVRQGGGQPL
ncbi:MAG: proline--tRNA ligase [Proteobacteria bacterium]|nr:proline--tRNA ligase [Pseudomonadota bacterium]MBU2468261.1 proline--tRNA ligase [Pseudomonadota bacterium]